MSFEILNIETSWNRRGKPPMVRISHFGQIRFTVEAVNLLGLKEGMKISFMINSADRDIIYFFEDSRGMPLRNGKDCQKGKRLEIYCRPLAIKLLNFFGFISNRTFDLTSDTTIVNENRSWFILKDKIHRPVKWKKQLVA